MTRSAVKKSIPVLAVLLLLGGGFAIHAWTHRATRSADPGPQAASISQKAEFRGAPRETVVVSSLAHPREAMGRSFDPQRAARFQALQKLIVRWDHVTPEEVEALVEESVKQLQCSDELIDLIEHLYERNREPAMLELKAGKLLRSADPTEAAAARAMVVGLIDSDACDGWNYRETWSEAAGAVCPPEEIETFCRALGSKPSIARAMAGFNQTLAATDPEAAVRSMTAVLNDPGSFPESYCGALNFSLAEEVRAFPAGVDFQAIDKLLPAEDSGHGRGAIQQGRDALFEKWSSEDPEAAVAQMISDPQRYGAGLVETVMFAACRTDYEQTERWIGAFPEGPYRDNATAAGAAALAWSDPGRGAKLAETIADPSVKKNTLERLDAIQNKRR